MLKESTYSGGHRELLPPTQMFFDVLAALIEINPMALATVGGDILIHIREVGWWTIVTCGDNPGLHDGAVVEEAAFTLDVEEWALLELINADADVDINSLIDEGYVAMEGDFTVFERLSELDEAPGLMATSSPRMDN